MTSAADRERIYVSLTQHVAAHERDPSYLFEPCFDRGSAARDGAHAAKAELRTRRICELFRALPVSSGRDVPALRREMMRRGVMSTSKTTDFFRRIAHAAAPGGFGPGPALAPGGIGGPGPAPVPGDAVGGGGGGGGGADDVERTGGGGVRDAPAAGAVVSAAPAAAAAAGFDPLGLGDMLNATWLPLLGPTVWAQAAALPHKILDRDRPPSILPDRELTFRALLPHAPASCRVVIFGQNPYPRRESAVGVACCDGAVRSWDQALSPTLRNVVKGVMQHCSGFDPKGSMAALRRAIADRGLLPPPLWFQSTSEQGVVWLNASLTFESSDRDVTKRHAQFWVPVIREVVRCIVSAKASAASVGGGGGGVVFVLWGNQAQKLRKTVIQPVLGAMGPASSHRDHVRFVETANPAVEAFLRENSFDMINRSLAEVGERPVEWAMTEARWLARLAPPVAAPAAAVAAARPPPPAAAAPAPSRKRKRDRAGGVGAPDGERLAGAHVEVAADGDPTCVVCLEHRANVCILECGHVCVCSACMTAAGSGGKKLDKCPLCRRGVWRAVPVFFG